MTATTYTQIPGAHIPDARPGVSLGAKLSRFFRRMIEAREKAVKKRIASHFQGLDNEHLVKLGYSPVDVARIRRG